MTIQWFPGHMTKAQREMQEKLKQVDMVIELRDARVVSSSANPLLEAMIGDKPRIIALTKTDKAEPEVTKAWIKQLQDEGNVVVSFDLLHDRIKEPIIKATKIAMHEKLERLKRKGIRPRATRAMVVGIPNVGKSTFINQLLGKKVAKTADKPGVTRSLTIIKVTDDLELLDTPGILWPKFEDSMIGVHLALTGAINDQILPFEQLASYAFERINSYNSELLKKAYEIDYKDVNDFLEKLALKRGYVIAGDNVDIERTQQVFIKDLRDNKWSVFSWDIPHE